MARIYKCRSSHCFHDSKEILPDDDFVKVKNAAYHKDCYQAILNIRETINLFSTKINPNVVFSVLRRVINNIVYDKKVDSGMLLYGVKYYIDHKLPLHYPQGLYYVVQNEEVQKKYHQEQIAKKTQGYQFKALEDEAKPFTYTSAAQKSFADVLGGDQQ